MSSVFYEGLASILRESYADKITISDDCVVISDNVDIVSIMKVLKNHDSLRFKMLIDICGVDYPSREKRFEVVYQLLSLQYNKRLTMKVALGFDEGVESVASVFSSACWFERETFDMFGIKFVNAPDPRRILTDYNFVGFPLRKDFPLSGFKEIRYDIAQGKIVESDISMVQEYRNFDFEMPWESVVYNVAKSN